MVAVHIVIFFAAFFILRSDGKGFRSPCQQSYEFRCDNGDCLQKHKWCDRSSDCQDGSDEKFCNVQQEICNENIHFKCDSGTMCIPIQGYCDGYSSCADQSDEKNCPCEEVLEAEGNLQYEAFIDMYRTQQKCWKISVNEAQYLDLKVSAKFHNRECKYGNVTVYSGTKNASLENFPYQEHSFSNFELVCPSEVGFENNFYEDVFIRYRSNYYLSSANSYKDLLNITFQKIDIACKQSDAFKCSKNSCISPEKQCDGNKDCEDGRDEENCDYGALSPAYLTVNKKKSIQWMRSQHNEDWGWKGNTHRAILALYLTDDVNFNVSRQEDDLIAKQLEIELFTYLLKKDYLCKRKLDKASTAELALYINALSVLCHDPHNFYGYDLINDLKEDLKTESSFIPPFPLLTLCNAKEPISQSEVNRLLEILELNSWNRGFILELQAHAALALSCVISNGNLNKTLVQNIMGAINNLKKMQMEDGSFGNGCTTALVLQALIANDQENAKDWNIKSSLQFLRKMQDENGSFGDFLTTYLTMPLLNAKNLADVGKVNCSNRKWPRDGNMASDINNRLGKKTIIKYSLFIGDEKDQVHPLLLRTPENITVLELMTLAADMDPKYKFKIHEIKMKKYIYEIYNIPNDPENNKFWFIYHEYENEIMPFSEQCPDEIKVQEKDHIIMWYRTLDSLED